MRRGSLGLFGVAGAAVVGAAIFGLTRFTGSAPPPAPAAAVRPAPAPKPAAPEAKAPSFDIVKVAPDGTAVVAGRAAPGARVTVLDGDKAIGAVTADQSGEWVLVPKAPLPPGDSRLRLEATAPGGRTLPSQQSVALAIARPAPGKGETALAVALPRSVEAAPTVLQRPAGLPSGAGLSLDTVEYGGKGGLALTGHASPGACLEINPDNRPLAAAKAAADGSWTATAANAGAGGILRLDQLGADGKVARRITVPLLSAVAAKLAPGQDYVVRPGNNLWQIARRSYGAGVRYLLIYSANLAKIHNPDLIYPGQVFRLPKS